MEAFNNADTKVVEELIHPNVKDVAKLHGHEEHERNLPVAKRVQAEIMAGVQAFPDRKFNIESIIAEGDTVILRWSLSGTHKGTLFGRKATGKQVKVFGTEIVRIQNGKIVEHDDDGVHTLELLRQLGWLDAKMRRKVGVE
jgi:predicted ester cyclase